MIHFDTSFLVDLLREAKREAGPAHRKLEELADESLAVSVFAACELHAGAEHSSDPLGERKKVDRLLAAVELLLPDDRLAPAYGRNLALLRKQGAGIATMDLLIATQALVDDAVLVTRNLSHFERVPGLKLMTY